MKKDLKFEKVIVLILGIFISIFTLFFYRTLMFQETEDDFSLAVSSYLGDMQLRIESYADILYGYRGLFSASEIVTENEWDNFSKSMLVKGRINDSVSINFVELNKIANPERVEYKIKYTTHVDNKLLVGTDLSEDKSRVLYIEQARDTGLITISTPISLLRETGKKAIVIYVPIYDVEKVELDSVDSKREHFKGVVSMSMPIDNFIEDVFKYRSQEQVQITVTEGDPQYHKALYKKEVDFSNAISKIEKDYKLFIGGKYWEIQFAVDRMSMIEPIHVYFIFILLSIELASFIIVFLLISRIEYSRLN